jgi:ComF family protein
MKQCLVCLDFTPDALCALCKNELPWIQEFCPRCGRHEPQNKPCALCQHSSCLWDQGFFPLLYQHPVSPMVLQLKMSKQFHYARTLVDLFLEILPRDSLPDLILPVPLHPWRLFWRGYNQSTELAKILSERLSIPYSPYSLKRLKHSPAQKDSDKKTRRQNVDQAFALRRALTVSHIALVDDVITTGETLRSLCKIIRVEYPTIKISVWTIAQTKGF